MNKQRIFVGITTDNELYFVEVEQPHNGHDYFAMTGSTYSVIEEDMFDIDFDFSPIEYNGKTYYLDNRSGGQHEVPINEMQYHAINPSTHAELLRIWKEHHLKKETVAIPAIVQDIDEELQKALKYLDNNNLL